MNRKIAIILPNLRGGGAEKMMLNLAGEMSERNLVVELLVIQRTGELVKSISPRIKVTEMGSRKLPFWLATAYAFFYLILYANSSKTPRFLSTLTGTNLFVLAASLFFVCSPIVVVREASTIQNNRSWMKKKLVRLLYPRAHSIVCVSKDVESDMLGLLGPDKQVCTINNPVDCKSIRALANESFSHPWLDDPNLKVIAAMGRLSREKGLDILLKAISLISDSDNTRLLILGCGELKMELEELAYDLGIQDNVEFLGYVENPYKIICRCNLFVLSSRWEGFVNSLLEALALKVKIVSADCRGGPRQILADGKYGCLVPVEDAIAMCRAIQCKLNIDRDTVVPPEYFEQYSVCNVTQRYIELYS